MPVSRVSSAESCTVLEPGTYPIRCRIHSTMAAVRLPVVRTRSELSHSEADEMVARAVAARTEVHLALVIRRRATVCACCGVVTAALLVDQPAHTNPCPVAQCEPTGDGADHVQGRPVRVMDLYEGRRPFAIGEDLETSIVDLAGGARCHYLHDHLCWF